jgi:hypothetical protein
MLVPYNINHAVVAASGPPVFTAINLGAFMNYGLSSSNPFIDVSWQPKSPSDATGFKIWLRPSFAASNPTVPNATITLGQADQGGPFGEYTIGTNGVGALSWELRYYITVTAYNAFGDSTLDPDYLTDWVEIFTAYPD